MHYPSRYKNMVAQCKSDLEPLARKEAALFDGQHAQAMSELLGKWGVPTAMLQPLEHVFSDDSSLSNLPDAKRSGVELVKLAILVGQIAIGQWEDFDVVELPSRELLGRLGISDIGEVIDSTKLQLPGISGIPDPQMSREPKTTASETTSRLMPYFSMSKESFDFLPAILAAMDIQAKQADLLSLRSLDQRLLVNQIGLPAKDATSKFVTSMNCEDAIFIRGTDGSGDDGDDNFISLPCSYAALQAACRGD